MAENDSKDPTWEYMRSYAKMPHLATRRASGPDAFVALDLQRELKRPERVLEKMKTLWGSSNSHGISWDQLDDEYLKWAASGQSRAHKWQDYVYPVSGSAFRETQEKHTKTKEEEILSQIQDAARWRAQHVIGARIKARQAQDSDYSVTAIQRASMESGLRRAYLNRWKRLYLAWFRPGQLIRHFRELTLLKNNEREMRDSFGAPLRNADVLRLKTADSELAKQHDEKHGKDEPTQHKKSIQRWHGRRTDHKNTSEAQDRPDQQSDQQKAFKKPGYKIAQRTVGGFRLGSLT